MRKIIAFSFVVLIVLLSGCVQPEKESSDEMQRFSSYSEMESYLKASSQLEGYGGSRGVATTGFTGSLEVTTAQATSQESSDSATDYSETNIQVEGVDEADIVKNDGKYIYTLSGSRIYIVDAYPADQAEILSNISFSGTPREFFINKDKLIVFGRSTYNYYKEGMVGRYSPSYDSSSVYVYDISDRSNPVMTRNFSVDGNYYDSRMIGDYVYIVLNKHFYYMEDQPIPLPVITTKEQTETVEASEIYYPDNPDTSNTFTTIISVNTQDDNELIEKKVYLLGYSHNMFVSQNNIYITYMKYMDYNEYLEMTIDDAVIPSVPLNIGAKIREIRDSNTTASKQWFETEKIITEYSNELSKEEREYFENDMKDRINTVSSKIEKEIERTVIHRIGIENGNIEYETQGYAPGTTLNQFSMDEHNNYFRIATTTSGRWMRFFGRTESKNHVYVLDEDLDIVGKVEDLAPGERIFSARFIGDRVYLVTFRQVDPFYVIDLSDPTNPNVLGYLKIPGFSNYLHPYDENHIIGIGKETVGGNDIFAWQQGVKISLFDVTDVLNPIQKSKYVIGHRGTESIALNEHKAFLFDKEKGFLAIPISLSIVDESEYPEGVPDWARGKRVWNGLYVLDITLEDGIQYRGRVTHDNSTQENYNYYRYGNYNNIVRSLYMDDILYTISNKMIKMNDLINLDEINSIDLVFNGNY